jgi:hypothetical protein
MSGPIHRLDKERPTGPVVWKAPPRRKLGAAEWLPVALMVLVPVLAWFAFAFFLD